MPQLAIFSLALILLPAIGYLLLLMIGRRHGSCWRCAIIYASIAWGVAVIFITELLSRPSWLTKRGLAIAWLAVDCALIIVAWRLPDRAGKDRVETADSSQDGSPEEKLCGADKALLCGMGGVILLTLITTLVAPQNHSDTLTYHLPRLVYWLQNHSVKFFPTNDGRQIYQPPGAEYAMLHLHMLAGTDRFDGLIQWFGFLLSVVTVSLIARRLGANRRTQILAAVFCATLPQGLLQATGGKNDYVLAFMLAAMSYFLVTFKEKPNLANMLGAAATVGLAMMTKGTAYFFAPALILAFAAAWPRSVWARAIKLAPAGLALILALNVCQWTRNYRLCGSPFGPSAEGVNRELPFANAIITPSSIFSNLMRNTAIHLWTPSGRVNRFTEKVIAKVVRIAGADVNDRRTTWHIETFGIRNRPFGESYMGNPWHFLLILLTFGAILMKTDLRRSQWAFAAGIAGAYLLFCVVLRWQPWHGRLHIPLFVISAAPVSLFLTRARSERIGLIIGGALLLLALPWALHNDHRSLLPWDDYSVFRRSRNELYFAGRREWRAPFTSAVAEIKKTSCPEVGIASDLGSFEYPLLEMLGAAYGATRVRHVGVIHPSRIYGGPEMDMRPCVVACLLCQPEKTQKYSATAKRVFPFNGLTVFVFKD